MTIKSQKKAGAGEKGEPWHPSCDQQSFMGQGMGPCLGWLLFLGREVVQSDNTETMTSKIITSQILFFFKILSNLYPANIG